MRVLYIVTAYSRSEDDVITPWLTETIHRLAAEGVESEVLAPAYRGEPGGIVAGVRVHRFRYAPRRWEDLTHDQTAPDRLAERPAYLALVPGYVASGMSAAWRLARRGLFDVVHVHWPIPHGLMGLAARRAGGVPLVCSFHGVELTWTQRRWRVLLPVLRRLIRTADAVTANSSYTAELVRSVHDREVVRIPFGATVDASDAAPAEQRRRSPGDELDLLFVGRLVERKGVHYLLDALARLADPRVRLRVVGDGAWRERLESQAAQLGLSERVRFDGFVSREELSEAYTACDALVLPAVVDAKGDVEGLGVVLVEAASHGKPVIASAAGGIVDVVRDGESGLLVPPGDAAALAAAIEQCRDDPVRMAAMGEAGRAHVAAEFSWPVIIRRLADLYRGLARHAGVVTGSEARE